MERKRLKRFWARARLLLACGGFGGCLLAGVLAWAEASKWVFLAVLLLSLALLTAMIAVTLLFLRCPGCGKTVAIGWWNPGQRYYCSCCGRPFLFDDDPPEGEEK